MPPTDHGIAESSHSADPQVGDGGTESPSQPPANGTRSVRLPHVLYAVRDARRIIVSDLSRRGVEPVVIEESEAVVSELVANSVRHARPLSDGCVRIRWKVKGGAVEVEVRDGGSENTPRPARPSVWSVRGRGLRIVRSMAHEWGVQEERNGRTVWAALGGPSRRRRI